MEKALEIIELNKIYKNNVCALDNINLTIEKGDSIRFFGSKWGWQINSYRDNFIID